MASTATGLDTRKEKINAFGQDITFEYSAQAIAFAIVFMRLTIGWILLQGGLTKVFDPTWTAEGYLLNAVADTNPLQGFFASMAGNPTIDFLNQWGLTLTGIGVITGTLFRFSAFWGAVMMFFYWLASLEGGIADLLPVAYGWIVDSHIVYIALLFGLGALGAGRILGVDGWLEKQEFVENNPWLRYFLG